MLMLLMLTTWAANQPLVLRTSLLALLSIGLLKYKNHFAPSSTIAEYLVHDTAAKEGLWLLLLYGIGRAHF